MKIETYKIFELDTKIGQVRTCEADLGEKKGIFFVYSESPNVDPCERYFFFHKYPLQMAMFDEDGRRLWHRELGMGVIPGVWLMPFISFDLNGDGYDEIWFLNNKKDNLPLNSASMVLERVDGRTGETIGEYHFGAENTISERLSHAYRFMIFAGYVKGEPVIVTQQGTYGDIYFQCYNKDMTLRWKKVIGEFEGSRASHTTPVMDINKDGIDEVIFGEHIISLDDGHEIISLDHKNYNGHSDVVLPFYDYGSGKSYIYTCREGGEYEGCPRIVTYDYKGNIIWKDVYSDEWGDLVEDGHMHYGFIATVMPNFRRVAYALRHRVKKDKWEDYYYDAVTGEKLEMPFNMRNWRPIDINGDGYHEYIFNGGESRTSRVADSEGHEVFDSKGQLLLIGRWFGLPGEQFMAWYPENGEIKIFYDADAKNSKEFNMRYEDKYRSMMKKMTGSGYNWGTSIDCSDNISKFGE